MVRGPALPSTERSVNVATPLSVSTFLVAAERVAAGRDIGRDVDPVDIHRIAARIEELDGRLLDPRHARLHR